ncbi:hypothetical protein BX666DRAFT_1881478 [Dichotomocladium elegans]|nr:hypothetical protein BX666DRAFT_1881478 [Dichotomocladium elegans]
MDKEAYRDLRDGLRYLFGRRPKKQGSAQQPAQLNTVSVDDTDADSWESWSETDSESFASDFADVGSETSGSNYDSDDTELDHPYDFSKMQSSRPLRAPVVINSDCVQAVFDTGASVSVLSRGLAEKLGLRATTGDTIQLSSLGQEAGPPSSIVADVPIRG